MRGDTSKLNEKIINNVIVLVEKFGVGFTRIMY